MIDTRLALLGAITLCLAAGPTLAQAPMPSQKPSAAPAPVQMSEADKKAWTNCKGMTHDAMMKDATCTRIMKAHPDAMKRGKKPDAKPAPTPK
jgi:hypothetical protein